MQTTNSDPMPHLDILTGPTGVGKTDISIDVARLLGTEILSADSMAVYRRMEVATAKPSQEQRSRAPHHLIDVADPDRPFSVADYRNLARPLAERLIAKGKTPLLVGGTRLYLLSLTAPFAAGPPPSPEFRASLDERSSETLHAELARLDPETAARLHPSDRKRIVRALEVRALSGQTITNVQAESREEGGLYPAIWVALVRDRQELYDRVNRRVDAMMAAGLADEVRDFLQEGFTPQTQAMAGHGYKEIMRALLGEYDLDEGIRLLKRNTRRYVKYQLMWLRGLAHVHYVRADQPHAAVVDEIVRIFRTQSPVWLPASATKEYPATDIRE